MQFTKLGSLVAFAGLSQAFLIPPTINDAIPFEARVEVTGAVFMLGCPGCPVVFHKDNVVSHAQSKLKIKVEVQANGQLEDSLLINGISVLPVAPSAAVKGLHADQLIQDPEGKWVYASDPELGYFLHVRTFHDDKHPGWTAYNLHFRIKEVANEVVRSVQVLDIRVIKTAAGKLMIANSHVSDASHRSPQHEVVAVVSAPVCNSILCKWKVTLFEKVSSIRKGCGRNGGPNRHPRPNGIFKGPHGRPRPTGFEHARPHPHNRHGHGHGHRRHLTVGRVIHDILNYIIVPVIMGAALGVAASILGAIVGHLIVFIWRALFRRGQRGQCSRQSDGDENVKKGDEEKIGLMEDQQAPPVYEEAVVDEKSEQK